MDHDQCTVFQLQIRLFAWSVKMDLGLLNISLLAADTMVSIISWERWTGIVRTRVSFPVPASHLLRFWRACIFLQCLAHIVFICERCLPGIDFSSIWPHVFFNSWLSSGSDSVSLSPVPITVFFNPMCAHAALSCLAWAVHGGVLVLYRGILSIPGAPATPTVHPALSSRLPTSLLTPCTETVDQLWPRQSGNLLHPQGSYNSISFNHLMPWKLNLSCKFVLP